LQDTGADSVVSVVPLPLTHAAAFQVRIDRHGRAWPAGDLPYWDGVPTRRQEAFQPYRRDGTVYAFRRSTVDDHGTIYGQDVRPLILEPHETCELDTEADWAAVQARWEREHA
jgi:CMP-N-acetylneuraminic acid synthetase